MMTKKFSLWLVATTVAVIIFYLSVRSYYNMKIDLIDVIQESTIHLFIALVPVVFMKIGMLIFSKPFSLKSALISYWVFLSVLTIGILIYAVDLHGKIAEYENSKTANSLSMTYRFPEADSEITVGFSESPKLTSNVIVLENNQVTSKVAELIIDEEGMFLRAEYVSLTAINLKSNLSSTDYRSILKHYAKTNGIQDPVIKTDELNGIEFHELRGYKVLKDRSNTEKHITFLVRHYPYKNDYLMLYAGGDSRNFPHQRIIQFFESVSTK